MINYNIIGESIKFYSGRGFQRIESPWTVSKYVDDITRPSDAVPFELKHNSKRLVASGEQSFLYLYLKGFIPNGKFQTVTPCFRDDSFDAEHSKYFIKNELIDTTEYKSLNGFENALSDMINEAGDFFKQYVDEIDFVKTKDGFDIVDHKFKTELGSYGIRRTSFLNWIYGTGCAEPRLSNVMKSYEL
jgi:hypothetical protein